MLTALRSELNAAMAACGPARTPSLRHAGREGWLLCSDVPGLIGPEELLRLEAELHAAGWRTERANGWLYFDKSVPAPVLDLPAMPGGEAGCVVSLLLRHPDDAPCAEEIRALCCASEKGAAHVERFCRRLHGRLAEQLRRHEPLPGALLPYIIRAAKEELL